MCLMTSQNKFGDQITCMKSSAFSRSEKSECMAWGKVKYELAERGFDPRTSGLWAQHASAAPLCFLVWLGLQKVVYTCRLFSCCCYYRSSSLELAFVVLIILSLVFLWLGQVISPFYHWHYHYSKAKKKNCYVALSRPTVKCEKTGSGFFFFFFMSDLGEEFAKNFIQWLKKALVYAFWLHSARVFPHLETLKKILENSTLSRYVKKKKKKSTDRPNFQILVGWGQHKK